MCICIFFCCRYGVALGLRSVWNENVLSALVGMSGCIVHTARVLSVRASVDRGKGVVSMAGPGSGVVEREKHESAQLPAFSRAFMSCHARAL